MTSTNPANAPRRLVELVLHVAAVEQTDLALRPRGQPLPEDSPNKNGMF